jgi:hypothetical protein
VSALFRSTARTKKSEWMISRECYWAFSCGVLLFLSGPFFICQCTLLHFELAMKLRFFLPVFSTLFPSLPLVVVLICKNFGHPARWRGYVRSTTNRNLYKTPSLSLNTSHNSEEFVGDPSRHLKMIHECQRASMMELPISRCTSSCANWNCQQPPVPSQLCRRGESSGCDTYH